MKNWIVAAVVTLAMAVPVAVLPHEGHMHKVLGTVTDVDFPHLQIETKDKKSVTIMLDGSTVITKGTKKIKDIDIQVGDRISADYMEKGGMFMVHTLKVGVAAPAK